MEYIEFEIAICETSFLNEDGSNFNSKLVTGRTVIDIANVASYSSESLREGEDEQKGVFVTYKDDSDPDTLVINFSKFKEIHERFHNIKILTPDEYLNRTI